MKLHEKIILYRKKSGISQESLAETIGVSRQAISKWETGDALPEIPNLKALAECFGVTVDFLIDDEADTFTTDSSMYEKDNNSFETALDTLEERATPFAKKYAGVGGIILAITGAAALVKCVIGLITTFATVAKFNAAGVFGIASPTIIGAIISGLFGLILPVCLIIGGIYITKKYKNK